jgi:hypothetical protein
MALRPAVLLPKLVGALSDPVLCLIVLLFHIIVLTFVSLQKDMIYTMAY